MQTNIKCLLALCAISVLAVSSCVKEEYDLNTLVQTGTWKPEIAMPLVHSKLSVEDILAPAENDQDELGVDPDGLMLLIYKDTLFSAWAQTFILGLLPGGSLTGAAIGGPYSVFLPIDSLDMNLGVYNKVLGGSFYFENCTVRVIVTSTLGVPVDMALVVLDAYSPINGTMPIALWGNTAPPNIALDNPSSPSYPTVWGDTAVTVYTFDENNSNIKDFIQINPKYIFYSVQADVNPLGLTDPTLFVLDTSEFSVELEVELPLYGTANVVSLGDTIPFELGLNDPSGSELVVTEAIFMVNTYNDFPVDAEMQLLFMDSNQVVIDSLFRNGQSFILRGASVGPAPALRTSTPRHTVTQVFVNQARLDNLGRAQEMIVRGRLTTSNGGFDIVKIYQDYAIEVKLGVKAKLQIGE